MSADPESERKHPHFSCPASELNATGDQKQAWGAWEGWEHPSRHARVHPPGREVQRWISPARGLKVDVQILRSPCEIPASGKEKRTYCMGLHVTCLSVCSCGMERTASICWGDLPCLQTGISLKSSVRHQSNSCRLPEPRQAHVPDDAKSAAGLSWELACQPAFMRRCGV